LFLGVAIVFAALAAKAYRINQIMRNAQKFRRVKVTVAQTLGPIAVLLTLNLIILSTMTALQPGKYEIYPVSSSIDTFGRPREFYGFCNYDNQRWYFLALGILNGGVLIMSVYQSWNARKLSTEFSESKYIFITLTCCMVLIFVGAPVIILARDTPNAVVFLGSAINFVCKFIRCEIHTDRYQSNLTIFCFVPFFSLSTYLTTDICSKDHV
jgi:bacteriorhodopsin